MMMAPDDAIGFIHAAATDPELVDSIFCEALTGEQHIWLKACTQAVDQRNEAWLAQYAIQQTTLPFPLGSDDPLATTNQQYPAIAQNIALLARAALHWEQSPAGDQAQVLVRHLYAAFASWQYPHRTAPLAEQLLTPPDALVEQLRDLLQGVAPTLEHLSQIVHRVQHYHPEWHLAAPAHLLAHFHTGTLVHPYRSVSVVVPLDLGTIGVLSTLHLESFRDGLGQFYADPRSMAFFDQSDSEFQEAFGTAWDYARHTANTEQINVCWRMRVHPNSHYRSTYLRVLRGNSIGAGLALGLLHLLDTQRRLIRMERLRWAITGALERADDGALSIAPVRGYERKLDAAMIERYHVLVPADDVPALAETWAHRLPALEGIHTLEEASAWVSSGGAALIGGTSLPATPPYPISMPHTPVCLGRTAMRQLLHQQLEHSHVIKIVGAAGIGKTTLAATIARERFPPDRIFWYRFLATNSRELLLRTLAWFCGWHGDETLWQQLSYHQAWSDEALPEWYLPLLRQFFCTQHYLLCFDDVHEIAADARTTALIQDLIAMSQQCAFEIILIGRSLGELTVPGDYPMLNGLSLQGTQLLFQHHRMAIDAATIQTLHTHLRGNPYYVMLTIQALKQAPAPEAIVAHLLSFDDTASYLNTQIAARLLPLEQRVLHYVAVLLGYPATAAMLHMLLDDADTTADELAVALESLVGRSLLNRNEPGISAEPQYEQHDLLRMFYYTAVLRPLEQRQLHLRVADFYLADASERDDFLAALHMQRAGLIGAATQYYTVDLRALMSKGKIGLLQSHLDDLEQQAMEMQVRIALGRGEMLRYQAQEQALEHLHRGLSLLTENTVNANPQTRLLRARLHLAIGGIYSETDRYDWAREHLEQSLRLIIELDEDQPADATRDIMRADTLLNLANVLCESGEQQVGVSYYQHALDIYEQHQHLDGTLAARHGLAIERELTLDWNGAVSEYLQLMELTERFGYHVKYVSFALSLSIVLVNRGNPEALSYLHRIVDLARQYHLYPDCVVGLITLADWFLRAEELAPAARSKAATEYLSEATALIQQQQVDIGDQQAELYRLWAESYIEGDDIAMSEHYANQATACAQSYAADYIASRCLRTLGRALFQQHAITPALAALQHSLDYFTERDPYEAARTQVEIGRVLLATQQFSTGRTALQAARKVFQHVGARELRIVEELLLK